MNFSTARQTTIRTYEDSFDNLDSLTITTSDGTDYPYTLDSLTMIRKNYYVKTQSLFLSSEYLFKTKGKSFQFYAGIGLKFGLSLKTNPLEQDETRKYQMINDSSGFYIY